MKHFAILGYPLGHTQSPQLHQRLAAQRGWEIQYDICQIPPEEFDQKIGELFLLDGFNVTIPYKVRIIDLLDELDQSAKNHGAVNVVKMLPDGRKIGYNTDCIGFVRTMQQHDVALAGKVCVLGAGGVGRMFATECALHGCDVVMAVKAKNIPQAGEIAQHIRTLRPQAQVEVQDIASLHGEFALMINATPCGMYPNMQASPIDPEILKKVETVFDCIYNPEETLLMKQAKEAGCKTVGGMEMLIYQAEAAQDIWAE